MGALTGTSVTSLLSVFVRSSFLLLMRAQVYTECAGSKEVFKGIYHALVGLAIFMNDSLCLGRAEHIVKQ
jgi:hypothetical protein